MGWGGVAILFKAGGQHSGTHQNKGRQTERLVAVAVVVGECKEVGLEAFGEPAHWAEAGKG